jgi:hypothetical protein
MAIGDPPGAGTTVSLEWDVPADSLPREERYTFNPEEGDVPVLEFRLTYKGRLPAESSSSSHPAVKHKIRQVFHRQLVELWKQNPFLRRQMEPKYFLNDQPAGLAISRGRRAFRGSGGRPWVEFLADDYSRCGFRFVPLVTAENGYSCSLDILFLRRDNPGALIRSGGDIDNRIKVLFDSLRIVGNCSELAGATPQPDENPFYCLLEDDSLITEVRVTTDRLLTPQEGTEAIHDVELVIHVKLSDPGALFSGNTTVI